MILVVSQWNSDVIGSHRSFVGHFGNPYSNPWISPALDLLNLSYGPIFRFMSKHQEAECSEQNDHRCFVLKCIICAIISCLLLCKWEGWSIFFFKFGAFEYINYSGNFNFNLGVEDQISHKLGLFLSSGTLAWKGLRAP